MTEKFEVLSDREHVRKRSGMYVGSVVPEDQSGIIDFKYQTKRVSPALIKIVEEVYQNSIDEFIRTSGAFGDKIDIKIINNPIDGCTISVEDNGRGIPIEKIGDSYRPVLAWTELRAGSNFSDEGRITAGTNGVGSSLVNIFSSSFIGETSDGKQRLILTCSDGMDNISFKLLKSNGKRGTKVTFQPELSIFGVETFDQDHIDVIRDRLINLAVSYEGITFTFNDEKIVFKNLKTLSKGFGDDVVAVENGNVKMVFAPAGSDEEFRCLSYVNGIYVRNGGSHVDYVLIKTIETVRAAIKKKHKIDVMPNQIRQHMMFASWISGFDNLKFESQTKERVINPSGEVSSIFAGIDFDKVGKQILVNEAIIEPMISAILHKKQMAEAAELRKLMKDADKSNLRKIVKFTDASQKNNREECYCFLAEGDSAVSSVLSARTPNIGCFPLRGKPINALAATDKDLLANVEFTSILAIMGLKIGQKVRHKNDTRFGNIVFCADADHDGSAINGLLIAMFHKYWPELFGLGMIHIFQTPILKIIMGAKEEFFYTRDDYNKWVASNPTKKHTVRYLKGLGSSTGKDFKKYFEEMDKNLINISDPEDSKDYIRMIYGKETGLSDKRKDWLEIYKED